MKMYVLVRNDLYGSQSAVQAGHALAQYCIDYPEFIKEWNNSTLVMLGVKDEADLDYWVDMLHERHRYSFFEEPDIGDQLTALAALDLNGDLEELFADLRLL